ncbi:hypothetical protein [Mycolicibacterium stellerae]|uniref:hypothetical protein n=1 Tax=Mycolicibacterium stellerae TaxID=2358193 RepID=UPI000F0BB7E5|nr:hypothetical protein [Mycolicibacterium stellerae]
MSRIVIAAALIVAGCCAPAGVAHADPAPPPPPPGPKTSFGDGTYAVGTDITPGVYQSAGPVGDGACYWKRVNGDGIVANAMTKKPQTVQIEAGDTAFTSSECQDWQKTDAAPPPKPNPIDVLGQLGSLLGAGAAPAAPSGG